MARRIDGPDEATHHLAEGEAALVLLEGLLHLLVGKGILTSEEVIGWVETAIDVKRQMAADGTAPELSRIAAGMLVKVANTIAASDPPYRDEQDLRRQG
jgi:hypothetical protein